MNKNLKAMFALFVKLKKHGKNYENRCLHHHIFDTEVLEQMCVFFKLTPILKKEETSEYIIVAKKA